MFPQYVIHPHPAYYESNPSYYEFSEQQVAQLNPNNYSGLLDSTVYESDEFRMYGFKIKKCPRTRSHDWTQCPFAHRGEKAKRRDPRRYNYAAVPCPDFQDGACIRGETCQYAHGVFEYWLHPEKYRTRPCYAGAACHRRVCFFAHSSSELRPEVNGKYQIVYPAQPESQHCVGSGHIVYLAQPEKEHMGNGRIMYPAQPEKEHTVGSDYIVYRAQHEREHTAGSGYFDIGASSSASTLSKPPQPIQPPKKSEVTTDFLASLSGLQIADNNDEKRKESRFLRWFSDN